MYFLFLFLRNPSSYPIILWFQAEVGGFAENRALRNHQRRAQWPAGRLRAQVCHFLWINWLQFNDHRMSSRFTFPFLLWMCNPLEHWQSAGPIFNDSVMAKIKAAGGTRILVPCQVVHYLLCRHFWSRVFPERHERILSLAEITRGGCVLLSGTFSLILVLVFSKWKLTSRVPAFVCYNFWHFANVLNQFMAVSLCLRRLIFSMRPEIVQKCCKSRLFWDHWLCTEF
jgi:hypothetical protein